MVSGLGYIGAGLTGVQPGFNQQWDQSLNQAGQIALGRTLQMLGSGGQQQQQPQMAQMPPMGGGQPPQQPQPMAGPSPQPQAAPPMGGPPGGGQPPPQPQRPMGGPPIALPPGGGGPGQQQPPQQQPQGAGPGPQPEGFGPQQGALDWRQIIQAVTRANPGAPPQVIARAVDGAIPLMNSQAQMEWKQFSAQLREYSLNQRDIALGQRQESLDRMSQSLRDREISQHLHGYLPGGPGGGGGQQPSGPASMGSNPGETLGGQQDPAVARYGPNIVKVGDAIIKGDQPPTTTGMYASNVPLRSYLQDKNFNMAQATLDYDKAKKAMVGLAGPQQLRFQQLGQSVINTMDQAVAQAKELQLTGVTPLNRAKIDYLVNYRGNTPEGQKAAQYLQTVSFLKGEVANLENGGYAPTESSWTQARNVINENYGVNEFLSTVPNAQRLINYRLRAQQEIPEGMAQGNRYLQPQVNPSQQGKTQEQAPQGKREGPKPPKVGEVRDGYEFMGGDPSKQESWKKVTVKGPQQ